MEDSEMRAFPSRVLLLAALLSLLALGSGLLTPRPVFAATVCTSSTQCPKNQLCCYPCGIDGCDRICMDTRNGRCPFFP